MKDNKEYLKDVYNKYEQEKNNTTIFYKTKINKRTKVFSNAAVMLLVIAFATTGVFAGVKLYEKILLQPSFIAQYASDTTNQIWCGTFQLVWNDLMDEIVGGPVEFEDYESKLANELNKQTFTKDMLSSDSYYTMVGERNSELKKQIEKDVAYKFEEKSKVLNYIDWENIEGYVLYAILKKDFTFLQPFDVLNKAKFANGEEQVKYFGIDKKTTHDVYDNVKVLFYNSNNDFAVQLKTKEKEDVILYRTDINISFDNMYQEMLDKTKQYENKNTSFTVNDTLKIPYINVKTQITYDELCNKHIKGTSSEIAQALQTVDIRIDNKGGKLLSETIIDWLQDAAPLENTRVEYRDFVFNDKFVMFLKESDKDKPYFAIFVNDDQVLEK